jgi:hypothetical protein
MSPFAQKCVTVNSQYSKTPITACSWWRFVSGTIREAWLSGPCILPYALRGCLFGLSGSFWTLEVGSPNKHQAS